MGPWGRPPPPGPLPRPSRGAWRRPPARESPGNPAVGEGGTPAGTRRRTQTLPGAARPRAPRVDGGRGAPLPRRDEGARDRAVDVSHGDDGGGRILVQNRLERGHDVRGLLRVRRGADVQVPPGRVDAQVLEEDLRHVAIVV